MPREQMIGFGPWAPDHPAFGGNQLSGGGEVVLEDAKGVYHTFGGYRPLTGPGTLVGAFGSSDFPELYTPNTMPTAAQAIIWLSDLQPETFTKRADSAGYLYQWDNLITGATNHATSVVDYWTDCVARADPNLVSLSWSITPQYLEMGGGVLDIDFPSTHTGTTLWALFYGYFQGPIAANFGSSFGEATPPTANNGVLYEFGNDGESAADHADSFVLRRNGTANQLSLVRNGETSITGATYTGGFPAYEPSTDEFIVLVVFNGTTKTLRENGAAVGSNASTAAFDISRLRLGHRGDFYNGDSPAERADFDWDGHFHGSIHECVVGTGTLTSDDIEKLEGWVAHRHGATGVLPSSHPYKAFAPQTATTPTANEPTSTFVGWSRAGVPSMFVGDYAKIFKLSQWNQTFTDVSQSGVTYAATRDEPWQFAQFGDRVIAVTRYNNPQYYDLSTSTLFADLPGSPPKARCVAQVRDFVFLGNLEDAGEKRQARVRWSGFDNSEDWTTDPGGTQADFQDLEAEYGDITGIVGGEFATVFQRRAITRFTYVGSPAIFQRDTVEVNRGCIAPLSLIKVAGLIYGYAHDGFFVFDGVRSKLISDPPIVRWVKNRLTDENASQMRVGHDYNRRVIIWGWPYDPAGGDNSASGVQLIFNYETGRWSYNLDTTRRWWVVAAPGDDEFLDADSDFVDDKQVYVDTLGATETYPAILHFDGELWRLSKFDGGDLIAKLETARIALQPGRRALIIGGRVVGNFDSTTQMTVSVASDAPYPLNTLASAQGATEFEHHLVTDGFVPLSVEGRYFGFNVTWDGGKGSTSGDLEELDVVQALYVEFEQKGRH